MKNVVWILTLCIAGDCSNPGVFTSEELCSSYARTAAEAIIKSIDELAISARAAKMAEPKPEMKNIKFNCTSIRFNPVPPKWNMKEH